MDNTQFLKELGIKIKTQRKKHGFTLEQIQEHGVTDMSNISRIESGYVNPHLLTLKKLADLFGVNVKDFL